MQQRILRPLFRIEIIPTVESVSIGEMKFVVRLAWKLNFEFQVYCTLLVLRL